MGSQSIATPQAGSKTERYRDCERALWDHYGLAPSERFIELASTMSLLNFSSFQ